jgi:hypothetical protein
VSLSELKGGGGAQGGCRWGCEEVLDSSLHIKPIPLQELKCSLPFIGG